MIIIVLFQIERENLINYPPDVIIPFQIIKYLISKRLKPLFGLTYDIQSKEYFIFRRFFTPQTTVVAIITNFIISWFQYYLWYRFNRLYADAKSLLDDTRRFPLSGTLGCHSRWVYYGTQKLNQSSRPTWLLLNIVTVGRPTTISTQIQKVYFLSIGLIFLTQSIQPWLRKS